MLSRWSSVLILGFKWFSAPETIIYKQPAYVHREEGNRELSKPESKGLTNYTYELQLRSNGHLLCLQYSERFAEPVSKWTRFHASCFTDAPRNPRPFFCGRMVLSFAPDSCTGLLFALSWVVLIKLCCRSSERRLMDAQEVWQLWEDAGQSGPAAICSLSFTALLMEKQTKQHGSEPCRQTRTHAHTP